jgi:hypothetical protein
LLASNPICLLGALQPVDWGFKANMHINTRYYFQNVGLGAYVKGLEKLVEICLIRFQTLKQLRLASIRKAFSKNGMDNFIRRDITVGIRKFSMYLAQRT